MVVRILQLLMVVSWYCSLQRRMNRGANIVDVEGMLSTRETLFVETIIAIDWCQSKFLDSCSVKFYLQRVKTSVD